MTIPERHLDCHTRRSHNADHRRHRSPAEASRAGTAPRVDRAKRARSHRRTRATPDARGEPGCAALAVAELSENGPYVWLRYSRSRSRVPQIVSASESSPVGGSGGASRSLATAACSFLRVPAPVAISGSASDGLLHGPSETVTGSRASRVAARSSRSNKSSTARWKRRCSASGSRSLMRPARACRACPWQSAPPHLE